MLPSVRDMANKLSKLQREFLIDHVDGMRPFVDDPIEKTTRTALSFRGLIRYEPPRTKRKPVATVLTDDGREVLCYILGNEADNVMRGLLARERVIDETREALLLRALHESARHWAFYSTHQNDLTTAEKKDAG